MNSLRTACTASDALLSLVALASGERKSSASSSSSSMLPRREALAARGSGSGAAADPPSSDSSAAASSASSASTPTPGRADTRRSSGLGAEPVARIAARATGLEKREIPSILAVLPGVAGSRAPGVSARPGAKGSIVRPFSSSCTTWRVGGNASDDGICSADTERNLFHMICILFKFNVCCCCRSWNTSCPLSFGITQDSLKLKLHVSSQAPLIPLVTAITFRVSPS